MAFQEAEIKEMSNALFTVLDGHGTALDMIAAAGALLPFKAAFCIVYQGQGAPVYLGDSFPDGSPKQAVQRYVNATYLLNPVYNAYLSGLPPGLHRMADLAPDAWESAGDGPDVLSEPGEEIGFRTPGWPRGLQELSLTVDLPRGAMGEISFARPAADGGFSPDLVARLTPFHPLFAAAFRVLWEARTTEDRVETAKTPVDRLEDFAKDRLTAREAEIVQLILKGHSSLSIGLTLDIALPTVKTHRRNAYAKLGVSTQQQLFTLFLDWRKGGMPVN